MSRPAQSHAFVAHDGQRIAYRHWPATGDVPKGAVLLFHRGHEHGGRMAHLVEELELPDLAFFAWDARGHGLSDGERGDAPDFATYARDVQSLVEHIENQHGTPVADLLVVAQSVGAVVATCWLHDYAPPVRGAILAAPAFRVKLYVPLALPALRLATRFRDRVFVKSYVRSSLLTHDLERRRGYDSDPLISRQISARILIGLRDTSDRLVADAATIDTPIQLLLSGRDVVVERKVQQRFFARLPHPDKECHRLEGFFHDTLGERDRHLALAPMQRFIRRQFSRPSQALSRLDADLGGNGCAEAEALARPLPKSGIKQGYWQLLRKALQQGARLSNSLKVGVDHGFDSGSMLDQVYRNRPDSPSRLGRLIDRVYLNAIGWRGIRQRRIHLEALIEQAVRELRHNGQQVHLVDIAAGHGRYILSALAALANASEAPDSVLLRDYSATNVAAGQALIKEMIPSQPLAQRVRFEAGDAFDRASLASLTPAPTLAVVSGLYELYPDNARVRASLSGLAEAMAPGALLVVTNQPWHPQLSFIARALSSHRDGEPWVMRCRSQVEMRQLLAACGFAIVTQRIDPWGIFSVILARRISP
ncbi:MAG: bifunctional alpha/beta hydrolase/class I SAM-dependent methyltransferase [Pseudomonadota bacterium]|nr:bifunctional alpha/beta hydrolase/class I SAM-dependent methyltransferase [Pseudomonadota bacterium]